MVVISSKSHRHSQSYTFPDLGDYAGLRNILLSRMNLTENAIMPLLSFIRQLPGYSCSVQLLSRTTLHSMTDFKQSDISLEHTVII